MDDPNLNQLQTHIDQLKSEQPQQEPPSPSGQAMRVGSELVACVAAGCGLGYVVDRWLDTSPWLLMLGLSLGFAAFMRNMVRAAKE